MAEVSPFNGQHVPAPELGNLLHRRTAGVAFALAAVAPVLALQIIWLALLSFAAPAHQMDIQTLASGGFTLAAYLLSGGAAGSLAWPRLRARRRGPSLSGALVGALAALTGVPLADVVVLLLYGHHVGSTLSFTVATGETLHLNFWAHVALATVLAALILVPWFGIVGWILGRFERSR